MKRQVIDNWTLYYGRREHCNGELPTTLTQLTHGSLATCKAQVPGNFLTDLTAAGVLPSDLYYGDEIWKTQEYEDYHLWYATEFELQEGQERTLYFGGIDTVSEIYIDGKLLGESENMFIPHEFSLDGFAAGKHELVVHIIPICEYVEGRSVPSYCRSLPYQRDTLMVRKAPYQFGWDIMPRAVGGGLWKAVEVLYKKPCRIEECYGYVRRFKRGGADLQFDIRIATPVMRPNVYRLRVRGNCKDSSFEKECSVFGYNTRVAIRLEDPILWWPKNYGEPDMYDVSVEILEGDTVCATHTFKLGVRTVLLDRRDKREDGGAFRFIINEKPIYIMGTNWVPTDAFAHRHNERLCKSLPLLEESGCNLIRLWGGNVYPDDTLYDWCDEHGIMIWQDFAMACGIYPQDERLQELLRKEAEWVITARRQHPSLVIWCGDNECDEAYIHEYRAQTGQPDAFDPRNNVLTRKVLPEAIAVIDGRRPYLPSSPYVSSPAVPESEYAERHLWGPRGDFKGEFYSDADCHFVSEMGYHGCPAPDSLKEFMDADRLEAFGDGKLCLDSQWLAHSACMEYLPESEEAYSYRVPLMVRQVHRLFGTHRSDIDGFARQSQISQAEADKFFVEHFRMRREWFGGLIWWNLIDGWPQISDAVADWYGRAKLAHHYIRFSQRPVCMMMDEPAQDKCKLFAVNDTRKTVTLKYSVENIQSGEVANGEITLAADEGRFIDEIQVEKGQYYLIRWTGDDEGQNHYVTLNDGVTLEEYLSFMDKAGYNSLWQGF